ncbi:uncharacterized protein TRIADDRAFT_31259 [Trichoplax adhaerens]|uniref:Protein DPCD n=1 Tax=Trichoplax adhaerens TaxID=10228 RepID=B3S8V1_TRIAD|nr:hypothetical protein TRIADDRAFT_31259 [Trichoplax adhaerens]EDV20765.1 hypothetical protein TRIADDRAFT_31259 [Trichoplax adhaerens]|eukprot:XP_002116706.1 hypothetical protein TRIADDRAFT_31259 [Trichoplax adhaerens]
MSTWVEMLKSSQKTCLVQDGRKKIHYTFKNHTEMAEEYDMATFDLSVRKFRKKSTLGSSGQWEYEIGEATNITNIEELSIRESNTTPRFSAKYSKNAFQWRIRNLPYPLDNYSITVDDEKRQLVLRTKNKKYFKRISIPDMDRFHLPLDQNAVKLAHANNCLIISYQKPSQIIEHEKALHKELRKMKASKDGDVECNPS